MRADRRPCSLCACCTAQGLRPKLKSSWPTELQELLAAAWAHDPEARPEMDTAAHRLRSLLVELNQKAQAAKASRRRGSWLSPTVSPAPTGSSAGSTPTSGTPVPPQTPDDEESSLHSLSSTSRASTPCGLDLMKRAAHRPAGQEEVNPPEMVVRVSDCRAVHAVPMGLLETAAANMT